jgi:chromodomain-containing protein
LSVLTLICERFHGSSRSLFASRASSMFSPELQRAIYEGLEANCPRVRCCPRASQKWSPRASELLVGARRARRAFAASGSPQDLQAQKLHQNLLRKELRRGSRAAWRKFVEEFSSDTQANDQEFEVEEILDHRTRKERIEYLIHWTGYDQQDNTWEPSENLSCPKGRR